MSAVRKLLLVIFMSCAMQQGLAATPDRVTMLERTTLMTTKLIKFAKQKSTKYGNVEIDEAASDQLIAELERLLSQEKSAAVLARVAIITRVFADNGRESRDDDTKVVAEILTEAWFACLTNIKKIGGVEALAALEDIRRNIAYRTIDGAIALAFDEAREEVKQGIKAKENKLKKPSKSSTLTK